MLHLLILVQALSQVADTAASGQDRSARIAVSSRIEEGKKVLVATVTVGEKPKEGVRVAFHVERAFGWLLLGKDTTLDDGTAAVPFPEGIPGGPRGELRIRATAEAPPDLASLSGSAMMTGARVVPDNVESFPRALWAPRAPIPLVLTVGFLLAGVWGTYLFVILQLARMARGARA